MTDAERLALAMWDGVNGTEGWPVCVWLAQRAIDAGWTPPPDPHEDIARELYDTAFAPARYADSRSVGPMLLAAVHRIPDDLARQVADALRGDDADG